MLRDLPQELVNNYYLDLHHQQQKIHSGYLQSLIPILNKKYLTPIDLRRIQELDAPVYHHARGDVAPYGPED